jgi:hypothetical protein
MLVIIMAAEHGGQELGMKVHDGGPGGFFTLLLYVPAFIGLLALERYLHRVSPERPDAAADHPESDAKASVDGAAESIQPVESR